MRHVHEIDFLRHEQELHREVRAGADTGGAVAELAGLRAGERDDFSGDFTGSEGWATRMLG
jgi:hypothetical protein